MVQVLKQLDVKTLLEHLVELEQHLGSLDAFKFYEVSSGFVHYNEISVAYEAERMLKHTGLLGYKVSIEFTTLNDNAAGCVAMNHAKEFTIKINQDKKYIDESVLGIVAHEICHKILYIKGLFYNNFKDEILCDLATIYLGFGKLTLNGCLKIEKDSCFMPGIGGWNMETITRTSTLGYLTPETYINAYRIVCECVGISSIENKIGLDNEILPYFEHKEAKLKTYSSKSLNKEQSDRIFERVERDAAAMNRNISMLERIMEKELQDNDQHMKNVHTAFNGTPTLLRNKYIDCLNHSRKDKHKEHITWSMITEMMDSYDSVFKHYVDNAPLYVRCPICGTKFAQRLTERKIAKYRCNKCGGIFLWNSEVTPKNRRFSSAWHYFKLCIKSLLADKTNNMTSL